MELVSLNIDDAAAIQSLARAKTTAEVANALRGLNVGTPAPTPPEGPPKTNPWLFDKRQAARYVGMSVATLARLVDQGTFPKPRHGGGKGTFTRWHIEDLNAWCNGKVDWK